METSVVENAVKLEQTQDQHWCEERKEGVKRLVNSLLIAQTFIEYDLDYHKLMDQKDIPECIDLLTRDVELEEMENGLKENFENSYPLLVSEDFTQIVSEYRAFFEAIDLVRG